MTLSEVPWPRLSRPGQKSWAAVCQADQSEADKRRYGVNSRNGKKHTLRLRGSLLDDVGRLREYGRWDGQAERSGGPEVDHEVEDGCLLDGQIVRLRSLEDLV